LTDSAVLPSEGRILQSDRGRDRRDSDAAGSGAPEEGIGDEGGEDSGIFEALFAGAAEMIPDMSALPAILPGEPEAAAFAGAMENANTVRLSVAGYLEAAVYVNRNLDVVRSSMRDAFLEECSIQIEPVTVEL
jgi:hypothetical protein